MRVITVNIPVPYLKTIDGLVGEKALYPSRSEIIRVAVREFLIKELATAKSFGNFLTPSIQPEPILPKEDVDPNLFVQIPVGNTSNGVPEFKTFRLVKK